MKPARIDILLDQKLRGLISAAEFEREPAVIRWRKREAQRNG